MTRAVPGWHGKLPAVSDFAGRRLDPCFVDLWDGAISASLAALREADEGWTDAYLACPTWRFLADRGVLPAPFDTTAWGGILMPSVDRVGRYYPLLIACPVAVDRANAAALQALWDWFEDLEEVAVGALHDDWTIERLEGSLEGLSAPGPATPGPALPEEDAAAPPDFPPAVLAFLGIGPEPPAPCAWYSRSGEGVEKVFTSGAPHDGVARLWTAHLEHA